MPGFLGALLDAFTPPLCVLCARAQGALPWLCRDCEERLVLFHGARCLRCGAPRPLPAPLCAKCPDLPRRMAGLRSAASHAGTARELAGALRFRGTLAAARPLGALAAAAARELPLDPDTIVVAVPLHRSRRRKRGYGPADEVARVVAATLGLRRPPRRLWRVRPDSGVVHRTPKGRVREVRGAFRAHPSVRGRPVLLVDVTLNTGAVLGSCGRALLRRGAGPVWAVTATRAL